MSEEALRAALQRRAQALLPGAQACYVELAAAGAPFKLVANRGSEWAFQPFHAADLVLACTIIARKIGIGVKP